MAWSRSNPNVSSAALLKLRIVSSASIVITASSAESNASARL
jgi:hypothetical protein